MASHSSDPKDDDELGPEVAAAASSYELKCPICLEDYDNKAFVNVCFRILKFNTQKLYIHTDVHCMISMICKTIQSYIQY